MNDKRLTPEEALNIWKQQSRGMLKIFLGYAPGVGKTYAMLNEANRRLKRGQDIVIGYVENHGREETDEQIKDVPVIPRKQILYNGIGMEELDVEAVLNRH
ncbi:MAG: sensor histidine kinase KdpD, partial [Clostridia bacterium]|nr:sensor histidine kinase KdpD [Clostridia bacterium]